MLIRALCAVTLALFIAVLMWPAFKIITNPDLHNDASTLIIAAPLLFLFFVWRERDRIFRNVTWNLAAGVTSLLLVLAAYLVFLRILSQIDQIVRPVLAVSMLILAWISVFVLCYGLPALRAAWFPLGCLVLLIPIPAPLQERLTVALQHGSSATSLQMLRLAGIPVFAQGTKFLLPGLEIEIAPECSGIRSCLALALLGLLASRLYLGNRWHRVLLVAATIPIAIFKNAIRISTIASLGAYVNHAVLFGPIHRYGGLVFTPLAVVLLVLLLIALQKSEARMAKRVRARSLVDQRTPAVTP